MANVENINRLIEHLKTIDAKKFRMERYSMDLESGIEAKSYSPCGTAFCIAGHANVLRLSEAGTPVQTLTGNQFRGEINHSAFKAASWLGLESEDGDYDTEQSELFRMSDCLDFDMDSFDLLPDAIRLAAGIRVLEILRDTDRVDWDSAIQFAQRATGTAVDL